MRIQIELQNSYEHHRFVIANYNFPCEKQGSGQGRGCKPELIFFKTTVLRRRTQVWHSKLQFSREEKGSGQGRSAKPKHLFFETTVLLWKNIGLILQTTVFPRENIGLALQTTVFSTKNKVLATVGVAGLNIVLSKLQFYKGKHRFDIANCSFPKEKQGSGQGRGGCPKQVFQNYSFAKEKHRFSAKVNPLLRKNIGFQQRLTLSLTLSGLRKPISEVKGHFCLQGFKIYIEKRG